MKLGVVIPSRGLIYAQTMQDIMANLIGKKAALYIESGSSLPECFNRPVKRALDADVTHVWMVEEDMSLPEGMLDQLIAAGTDIATANYPVAGMQPVILDHGFFTQYGTGCTLIRREVFEKLGEPYFKSDVSYDARTFESYPSHAQAFGGHDIDFCIRAKRAGFSLTVVDIEAGQYRITERGADNVNDGAHKIETWLL